MRLKIKCLYQKVFDKYLNKNPQTLVKGVYVKKYKKLFLPFVTFCRYFNRTRLKETLILLQYNYNLV